MIGEQLAAIRKNRRTLLYQKKALVKFISDDTIDNVTLLNMITMATPYTTQKSLLFERHQLSEKENTAFDRKFSAFLKGLIARMGDPAIDLVLEYLVRVYNADTYNANELLFLMLPFSRYSEQIGIIAKNSAHALAALPRYSVTAIASASLKDVRLFRCFVEYFRHYELLRGFLDELVDSLAPALKGSSTDYLSEMHQIFVHLIAQGRQQKALELYHRLRTYLDSDDFVELLLPFYCAEVISRQPAASARVCIFEDAQANGTGRRFLGDEGRLRKYLCHCEARGILPSEFSPVEHRVLLHITGIKEDEGMRDLVHGNFDALLPLYTELGARLPLTKLLCAHPRMPALFKCMGLEDVLCVARNCDAFHPELLTNENHGVFIRNLRSETLSQNYERILEQCLGFVDFDATLFPRLVLFPFMNDVVKQNTVDLALRLGHSLVDELFDSHPQDPVVLRYLLRAQHAYAAERVEELVRRVKAVRQAGITADAAAFLGPVAGPAVLRDFCEWAVAENQTAAVLRLLEAHCDLLGSDMLWEVLLQTGSPAVLRHLLSHGADTVHKLYNAQRFDLLLRAKEELPLKALLVEHPSTFDFIYANYAAFQDAKAVTAFAVAHAHLPGAAGCLVLGLDHLIEFRSSPHWPVLKRIIIEGCTKKRDVQRAIDHVLWHLREFNGDADLFAALIAKGAHVLEDSLQRIVHYGAPAADLLDVAIRKNAVELEVTQFLPAIVPLMIEYKKDAIETLFKMYTNILCVNARDVLLGFPEKMRVLLHLDPRYSLKAIAEVLSGSGALADDKQRQECADLLLEIFSTQTCKSPVAVANVARSLCSALAADEFSDDVYTGFVAFYIKSFGDRPCSATEDLLLALFAQHEACFHALVPDHVAQNPSIFRSSFSAAVDDILQTASQKHLDFVGRCIACRPEELGNETALALCTKLFEQQSEASMPLIAAVCRANTAVARTFHSFVEEQIASARHVEFALVLLAHLFKSVSTYKANHPSAIRAAIPLTESRDRAVAEKAKALYECLQFLS
ncbi:hypothetical protein PAPHI01_0179 [Pancytospora philotis]|nr:hypothetical protein PAPHI01_0179 [Pancytospora philotis]